MSETFDFEQRGREVMVDLFMEAWQKDIAEVDGNRSWHVSDLRLMLEKSGVAMGLVSACSTQGSIMAHHNTETTE